MIILDTSGISNLTLWKANWWHSVYTSNPDRCNIMLNGNQIPWASKVRYLGLYFLCNSGMLDMTKALRKFYGSFNNIMSIIGKQSNEMVAVHLAKTYCLPSLTYGCEVWNINRSTLQCTKWMWRGMHASGAFLAVFTEKVWSHCSSFAVSSLCLILSTSASFYFGNLCSCLKMMF